MQKWHASGHVPWGTAGRTPWSPLGPQSRSVGLPRACIDNTLSNLYILETGNPAVPKDTGNTVFIDAMTLLVKQQIYYDLLAFYHLVKDETAVQEDPDAPRHSDQATTELSRG